MIEQTQAIETGDIRVIGWRSSGKTTFLIALATLSFLSQLEGVQVEVKNEEANRLKQEAKDTFMQQTPVAPTDRDEGLKKNYYFSVTVPVKKHQQTVEFNIKDFAGELFPEIRNLSNSNDMKTYVKDWLCSEGLLIMLTDWQAENDGEFQSIFEQLNQEILDRQEINPETENLRIAIVMNKCERGELWPCRFDAEEDLFQVRLRETHKYLTGNSFAIKDEQLKFFACSSFGVLGNDTSFDPRPNRSLTEYTKTEELVAVVKDIKKWKPFGLISPLYWLTTGEILPDQSL